MNNVWTLIVDQNSNRFFIKPIDDNTNKFYIVKEDSIIVDIISLSNLQKNNYKIVGDAFDSESKRLNRLLEDTVF